MALILSETAANGRTGRMILIGTGCAAFMNILDGTIVTVSLPSMMHDLSVETDLGIAVLLAYTIMLAGTVLMFGQIADRWGMRRVMIAGVALFTASSLVCGIAPSLPVLVLGRLVQGIGGGMLSATSLGAIGYYFPPELRGAGIGIISAASALGATLGSPLGGILSEFLGWRWIFLVNIPVGAMALCIAIKRFPPDPACGAGSRPKIPDLSGVILSIAALTLFLAALSRGPETGWFSPDIMGGFILAAMLGCMFLIHEHRSSDPLLDLALFQDPRFCFANLANVCTSMMIGGFLFLMPFYLILVSGLSQSATGGVLLLFSGVYILVSPVTGMLSDCIGNRLLTTGGMAFAVLALAFAAASTDFTALVIPVAFLIMMGIAYGTYLSPNNRQILHLAPDEKQGTASGIIRFFFYIGQPIGVVLVESVIRPGIPSDMLAATTLADPAVFQAAFIVCCALAALSAGCSFFAGRDLIGSRISGGR
jgi:EmrB/QacA subfamily drug resistance transporter